MSKVDIIDWSNLNPTARDVPKHTSIEPSTIKKSLKKNKEEKHTVESPNNSKELSQNDEIPQYSTKPKKIKKHEKQQEKAQQSYKRNSILKDTPDSQDEHAHKLFDQVSSASKESSDQERSHRVTFDDTVVILNDSNKKDNPKIENEKKGRFSPEEQKTLYESIQQYCQENKISERTFNKIITSEENPDCSKKMLTIICSVLPRRSLQSCFRFIKRQIEKSKYKSEWSKEEAEELRQLYDKLGSKWKKIAEQLGRTPENVKQKFNSMNSETTQLPFWSTTQTIKLIRMVQDQFEEEFIHQKGLAILQQNAATHDKLEAQQRSKSHSGNLSNTFVFHILSVVMAHIKYPILKTIDFDSMKWSNIVKSIPTKSKDQCKTKWKQIIGLQHIAFSSGSQGQDRKLIELIKSQNPQTEEDINFDLQNGRTSEQNKQSWRVLKKFVEGRIKRSIQEVIEAVGLTINKHPHLQKKSHTS